MIQAFCSSIYVPDPYPTLSTSEKLDPDPTFEKKNLDPTLKNPGSGSEILFSRIKVFYNMFLVLTFKQYYSKWTENFQ